MEDGSSVKVLQCKSILGVEVESTWPSKSYIVANIFSTTVASSLIQAALYCTTQYNHHSCLLA